jgi:hypothetical protein
MLSLLFWWIYLYFLFDPDRHFTCDGLRPLPGSWPAQRNPLRLFRPPICCPPLAWHLLHLPSSALLLLKSAQYPINSSSSSRSLSVVMNHALARHRFLSTPVSNGRWQQQHMLWHALFALSPLHTRFSPSPPTAQRSQGNRGMQPNHCQSGPNHHQWGLHGEHQELH